MSTLELIPRKATGDILRLDRALAIYGWMRPEEVLWLGRCALTHSNIVEIGAYLGRSTRALVDNTPGRVTTVDDFKGPRDAEHEEAVFEGFIENMEGALDKLTIAKMDFDVVDPADYNPPFDMIFIDGGHDYVSVRRDIDKWWPFLIDGGLFCGHDFEAAYPGVQKAVLETFTYHVNIEPNTKIWYVTK